MGKLQDQSWALGKLIPEHTKELKGKTSIPLPTESLPPSACHLSIASFSNYASTPSHFLSKNLSHSNQVNDAGSV